jgi:hypothetical protein
LCVVGLCRGQYELLGCLRMYSSLWAMVLVEYHVGIRPAIGYLAGTLMEPRPCRPSSLAVPPTLLPPRGLAARSLTGTFSVFLPRCSLWTMKLDNPKNCPKLRSPNLLRLLLPVTPNATFLTSLHNPNSRLSKPPTSFSPRREGRPVHAGYLERNVPHSRWTMF